MLLALISVSDKDGILEFAESLTTHNWRIIASSGTAHYLKTSGIDVSEIAEYTKTPEILEGRVKTLHPAIFAGILSRNFAKDIDELNQVGAQQIDLVAVNLYPFYETIQEKVTLGEAVEMIDIGGVALIRAAAKNFDRVSVIVDPVDYQEVISEVELYGNTSLQLRKRLAVKAFRLSTQYDATIAKYLSTIEGDQCRPDFQPEFLDQYPCQKLRYGENPHQSARYYHFNSRSKHLGGKLLQGKVLSYNNLLDLDAAWCAVTSFDIPSVVVVKHLSPCGIASNSVSLSQALKMAVDSDPVSAFGSVIATNRIIDGETVKSMGKLFIECVVAPDFSTEALDLLSKRKNCRLLQMPNMDIQPNHELRSVVGGFLLQEKDLGDPDDYPKWQIPTIREPTNKERETLKFAWIACQFVKSNAIVLAKDNATVGIGCGQPNRVDSVRIAIRKAGERSPGAAMASDAFFPFRDSIQEAAQAGISAIIQPGGSIRDKESIEEADKHNIAMVLTGIRHFRH